MCWSGIHIIQEYTANFTLDDWLQLTGTQRPLYQAVMRENCAQLVSVGCCFTKPEVISRLEQREELWPLEGSQAE